ncbi:hypothetical protein CDL12_09597 [Handroanthus impetiginosus]|uniref:Uncharacterized protein n=1 Tax=Handroanthus impetiginosus TaxID=429701 RepID=A0A2G9HJN6_9LAMI|nr:hypothetical protein CDL12_09597 [Handroanthus impetiginosus]
MKRASLFLSCYYYYLSPKNSRNNFFYHNTRFNRVGLVIL